jgi:hypothetical protein
MASCLRPRKYREKLYNIDHKTPGSLAPQNGIIAQFLFGILTERTFELRRTTTPFDPNDFLAKIGGGRTISKYRKKSKNLLTRRCCQFCFLYPEGKGESRGSFRAWQRGRGGDPWKGRILR